MLCGRRGSVLKGRVQRSADVLEVRLARIDRHVALVACVEQVNQRQLAATRRIGFAASFHAG